MIRMFVFIVGLLFILNGCSNNLDDDVIIPVKVSSNSPKTRALGNFEDYDVVSNEIVVLNDYSTRIYPGATFYINSVADATFRPVIGEKAPMVLSVSLPGTDFEEVQKPCQNSFLTYLRSQMPKAAFDENPEFHYSLNQFVSYNELESATGTSKSTNYLFFSQSSNKNNEEHKISKKTGIYIKFWQSSFSVIMDDPKIPYVSVMDQNIDSAVFVNSLTYGRLGIMTLETNEDAKTAKAFVEKAFNATIVNGTKYLSSEERNFLVNCDARVYIQGGSNEAAGKLIDGLSAFTDYIKSGHFSKSQPGVPIFASFEKVSDNSLAQIKFKYQMRAEPVYVDFIDSVNGGLHHLSLHFYKNRSRFPALANANIDFKLEIKTWYDYEFPLKYENTVEYRIYNNTHYEKGIHLINFIPRQFIGKQYIEDMPKRHKPRIQPDNPDNPTFIEDDPPVSNYKNVSVKLCDNPDFELLGENPQVVYY